MLLNMTLIAALLLFDTSDPMVTARNQAIAVSVAGLLQLLWLALAARANGISLRLRRPRLSPDVRRLLKLTLPAAVGAGAVQVNLVISTALAAALLQSGSVTYIYMADRLNQLPLGLIGIALGTVLLPTISRQLGAGDTAAAMQTQNRGLELALLLTLPAAAALIVCGGPIVSGLFGYGRFDAEDVRYTTQALAAFSLGLPAYILVKVLTPAFYARQDTRTPVRYGLIAVAVNLALNLALIVPLQHMGPPLATAIASTVNVVLLYRTLRKRDEFVPDARLRRRWWRLVLAALAMGAALWFTSEFVQGYVGGFWYQRAAALAVLVAAGGAVYGLATLLLGAFTRADIAVFFRRGRVAPSAEPAQE